MMPIKGITSKKYKMKLKVPWWYKDSLTNLSKPWFSNYNSLTYVDLESIYKKAKSVLEQLWNSSIGDKQEAFILRIAAGLA